jgi:hypothetical protein
MPTILARGFAAVVGIAGCSAQAAPAAPGTAGPSCAAVADHLLHLAERDNATPANASLATGIRAEAEHQCAETPWSIARRDCLLRAHAQDETLHCPAS